MGVEPLYPLANPLLFDNAKMLQTNCQRTLFKHNENL